MITTMRAARVMAITTITMTDPGEAALYRLMAWLSPSYPVGAFSYSHGLEQLVEDGAIADLPSLVDRVTDILTLGGGRSDAIVFACAHRAASAGDQAALESIRERAIALAGGAERHLETTAQGAAFRDITVRTWDAPTLASLGGTIPYPVAVAIACADHGIALHPALGACVHGFAANLVSAAVRLVPLGHSDGQRSLRALEPAVARAVAEALIAPIEAAGGITVLAEMAAMRHETQYTRLFRT